MLCSLRALSAGSITITLSAFLLITASPLRTEADEPSLSDTLGWMDSTYNPHGTSPGHGKWETFTSNGKVFQRRTTHFTYNGCSVSFLIQGGLTAERYQDT